jgi:hypothetical protein
MRIGKRGREKAEYFKERRRRTKRWPRGEERGDQKKSEVER